MKKISLIFFSYFFHIYLKNVAFPFYIFRTYHFDSKIIVSLSIASHSIQQFPFVKIPNILQEHPVFQNKHFNPNYTRITERGDVRGREWGGDFISLYSLFSYLFTDKNLLKQAKYFAPQNQNLTSWSINNAKVH